MGEGLVGGHEGDANEPVQMVAARATVSSMSEIALSSGAAQVWLVSIIRSQQGHSGPSASLHSVKSGSDGMGIDCFEWS